MTSTRPHPFPSARCVAVAALVGSLTALPPAEANAASSRTEARTASRTESRTALADGAVVSAQVLAVLSADEVAEALRGKIDAGQVRHGVTAYRVAYRTRNSSGAPTTASQLVVLPRSERRRLTAVSWLHGTTVYRKDVASVNPDSGDRLAALLLASTGRAVSAPDYVGLGTGEGFHPYGDPRATVAAAVDGLRAARTLAHRTGRELHRDVQVSGFSQGGHATMLVGRALGQERADPYFRPGALAPVSGPFHLSAFEAAAADDEISKSGLYLAYFATAWKKAYGLYGSPSDVFRPPYDRTVEGLFDGHHTTEEIAGALPGAARDLFTEDFLAKVRRPTGLLAERLRPLDRACDWRPGVPVELFHGRGDRDVDFSHSAYCARRLTANGAPHRLTDVGDLDHNASMREALPRIVRFFEAAERGPH
ncbi:hypothetical protein [Streptomyces sp. Da 82-17]|uniref:hypothetical protein n=1 Tax=Streptomyces sp. Da 82-17 TaxID=3377116 RepID=UPI0038D4D2D7